MTDKFRIFRRASGVWYLENRETREQSSLRTRVQAEAKRLLQAKNEALRQPAINVQIARAYLTASDPKLVTTERLASAVSTCTEEKRLD